MSSWRSAARMRNSGRLKTSAYSARIFSETNNMAGGVTATIKAACSAPLGLRAPDTTTFVSMTSLRASTAAVGSRQFYYALNLAWGELVSAPPDRYFSELLENLRFRRGQANVVLDAQEYGLGTAPLLNDKTPAIFFDLLKDLPELTAGGKSGNNVGHEFD